jgi:GDP/UDP-N,N'-diacetylbacillosamine 2-epimerase (hydrolysing)
LITKKICIVTGSRAEYGLFFPIMKKIQCSSCLKLQVVATTMHLSKEFGNTYEQIEKDGFLIDEKIENLLSSDTKISVAKSTGLAIILLSDAFDRLNPDIVLLLGDRFETHAAATTAMLMGIPIAHIHGGEVTEGSVDEKIRHSITKMSSLHFTSTNEHRDRVMQMGEFPDTVHFVGAPGIDNIFDMNLLSQSELEKELKWKFSRYTALFTFHPETLYTVNIKDKITKILEEISKSDINVLFTYANSDNGGRVINHEIEEFSSKDRGRYLVVKNLGQLKYLSAIKHLDFVIGNTSSGIIEAASFQKPVINIGSRQQGRMQSANVINSTIEKIGESINKATSKIFIDQCKQIINIYGTGEASQKIVAILKSQKLSTLKFFNNL